MKEKKLDRRIQYTRMVIEKSFVQLLGAKNLSQITVKEICELADINRATFYSHYADIFDLQQQLEDKVFAEIDQSFPKEPLLEEDSSMSEMIVEVLYYIKENRELFLVLLGEHGDTHFKTRLTDFILEHTLGNMDKLVSATPAYAPYICNFFASGGISTVSNWLKEGAQQTPEEIADLLLHLSIHGLHFYYKHNAD